MKNFFSIFLVFCSTIISFSQENEPKKRYNHIISTGITNSMFFNSIDGINDVTGYSKKQFIPGLEIGYLFSYQFKERIALKGGLNLISYVRNGFSYYGHQHLYSRSNSNVPLLVEFIPVRNSPIFISLGVKISYNPYDHTFESNEEATETTPKIMMSEISKPGINPKISFGIGKLKMICDKFRLEWLLSYNHGTNNSLRTYKLVRYEPYIVSTIRARDSHLNLTLRCYF